MPVSAMSGRRSALVVPWTAAAAPVDLAARLLGERGLVFLDSASEVGGQGRWSFLLIDPQCVLTASHGALCLQSRASQDVRWSRSHRGLFDTVRDLLRAHPLAPHPEVPFVGGAAGYWGYELGTEVEPRVRRRRPVPAASALPDAWIGFYDLVYAFDHASGTGYLVASGDDAPGPGGDRHGSPEERVRWLSRKLSGPRAALRPVGGAGPTPEWCSSPAMGLTSSHTRATYTQAVRRALAYIAAGDIYQVNLSQRFQSRLRRDGHPWALYRRLRERSSAPFAAYVDAGDHQVLSSSPERFLRIRGREVETRPIKGTRPRGADPAADADLARALLTSPKDRAELVMIVDLERNDLGRVCDYGSVRVADLCALESHPTVHHLVATVCGRLREEVHPIDCLRACFPGGSITGAPKVRAMEIIAEMEPFERGVYTGAIGYCGFDGTAEWNIAIRTMRVAGEEVSFCAGGGIVADSDPDAEYEETLHKARGMQEALGLKMTDR
ncbi:MAG: aminodeoxychorismate synthase component I [Armatimonadetes bacterium]|nr:aminodeoxychorismate synthase component I [Armatimonadota bacterium]